MNIGGGATVPFGDLGAHFATGWGPEFGVTVDRADHKVGLQIEYAYRYFQIKDSAPVPPGLAVGNTFSANHRTHQLGLNLVANLTPHASGVRGYLVAGPGAYYRKVEITKYQGSGVICDPFWYVCGTYPVTSVEGSRGGWDFGFSAGGGVGFRIGVSGEAYIESRYHYVWGPDIQPTAAAASTAPATGGRSNGQYWPLTIGIRF